MALSETEDQCHWLEMCIEARLAGGDSYTSPNGTVFESDGRSLISRGGLCSAFAHRGFLAAGLEDSLFGATALATMRAFTQAGYSVAVDGDLYRNDLLFFADGSYGHVVTYMGISQYGKDTCLENTSGWRGTPNPPGCKYTSLQAILDCHHDTILRVIRYTGS